MNDPYEPPPEVDDDGQPRPNRSRFTWRFTLAAVIAVAFGIFIVRFGVGLPEIVIVLAVLAVLLLPVLRKS